ncbi:hypothetical protein [Allomuricauda sp. M10]|jgi:hypothetical protein|uniref:hypothetical protein n=1 Tax=Allomuricauda sp. M10 TaxID=2683292 RepID=UPI001D188CB6|nr:hypothetical protein [Muricauda sp. M10]
MKTKIVWMLVGIMLWQYGNAQSSVDNHRNFPLIVSIEFHSLSLPFKNKKPLFSNIGIGLGTEVSHNGKRNWVQEFKMVWYGNKRVGGGLLFQTQAVWRPTLFNDTYSEIKLGVGYLYAKRPKDAYQLTDNGWKNVGKKGKGMLVIPATIGLGYDTYGQGAYVSPFANYQFLLATNYNDSMPVVPFTLMGFGSRIHF